MLEQLQLTPLCHCVTSPPQGGRLAGAGTTAFFSPLAGEMSAQTTEGGVSPDSFGTKS
jgi:hypothetical protein